MISFRGGSHMPIPMVPSATPPASFRLYISSAQPSTSVPDQNAASTSIICSNKNRSEAVPRRNINGGVFVALIAATWTSVGIESCAIARERRNRKEIPVEDFLTTSNGVKYFDVREGRGPVAEKGKTVLTHFDCVFRGITAVSSRESKLLGGNRIISQPYEFVVGSVPGRERKREYVENANGLFSAQAAPKPPPVLYDVVEGMRVGGKRTVIVPPEIGYGDKGVNEIPPGATFEMNIELLEVK